MKLRTIGMAAVAALALVAARAEAVEGGWTDKYGMIFTLQNVFQNNSAATLGDIGGKVGLQYNLAPTRAFRFGIGLSRSSIPESKGETTNLVTGITEKTYTPPGATTYGLDLSGDYLMRLTTTSFAPYAGVGAYLGYAQAKTKYTDELNFAPNVRKVDNTSRGFGLGAEGLLGVEWRVHQSVSLFAEYALQLDLIGYQKFDNKTQTYNALTGLPAGTNAETTASSKKYFNFRNELGQGGVVGLVAFF